MLGVYMDKAGPNTQIPAVTVAGVISTVERWMSFSEEWTQALHDFEDLPYFHMTEYDSGIGLYKEWQARGVKQERLARLLDIMERHILAVVGASVSIADCASFFADKPVETGYGITATHTFMLLPQFRYVAERPTERIVYTFEAGDQGHGKLQQAYDEMYASDWRRAYNRLEGKLEVEMKDVPALQAADILAFEGWKQWAREFGGDDRPTRYPYTRLTQAIPTQWATMRPTAIRDLVSPTDGPVASLVSQSRWVTVTAPLPSGIWG